MQTRVRATEALLMLLRVTFVTITPLLCYITMLHTGMLALLSYLVTLPCYSQLYYSYSLLVTLPCYIQLCYHYSVTLLHNHVTHSYVTVTHYLLHYHVTNSYVTITELLCYITMLLTVMLQ